MPDPGLAPVRYAIGDIHGEADRLGALHERIFDWHGLQYSDRRIEIVHLGDYVDRGPDSCGAIDRVIDLETRAADRGDLNVVSLMGNHERMLLDAHEEGGATRNHWLNNGGEETLESYQRVGRGPIDLVHLRWMTRLPAIHRTDDGLVFVHAGVSAQAFPDEADEVYLWTRSADFFDPDQWTAPDLSDAVVIHGHTPTDGAPEIAGGGRRINVDTGAVFGGPLTAAVLAAGDEVRFLTA
ncbi:MAG: metallophosphoesterase family protein [Pseudomonadota bacterium]